MRWLYSLAVVLLFAVKLEGAAAKRPNFLFLFADDWGRHASIYAELEGAGTINDVVQPPNCDALAREEVLFTNAYVSTPSCTPCRNSLPFGQISSGRAGVRFFRRRCGTRRLAPTRCVFKRTATTSGLATRCGHRVACGTHLMGERATNTKRVAVT
ncbi:MAG: sulfatase-like hydrolase/transferase [Opitutaceae bacterium]|nr:sulfatase-like hydrolase/transferase [Opitutaceae bacterium]